MSAYAPAAAAIDRVGAQIVDVAAELCVPIQIDSGGATHRVLLGTVAVPDNEVCAAAANDFFAQPGGTNLESIDIMLSNLSDANKITGACDAAAAVCKRKLGAATITLQTLAGEAAGVENSPSVMATVELGKYSMMLTSQSEKITLATDDMTLMERAGIHLDRTTQRSSVPLPPV